MGGFTGGDGSGGGGSGVGGDIGSLGSILGAISGSIGNSFSALESWVTQVFGTLASAIGSIFNSVLGLFQRVHDFLKHLKDTWLGHIISSIWARFQAFKKLLHRVLDPYLETMKRIKGIQDYYWKRIMQPLIDLMQRARQVLVVFRLLHFKWADKLDKDLQGMETKLARLFIDARRNMNILADWISFILDPTHLLNHSILLGSAVRSAGALYAILFGKQLGKLSSIDATSQAHGAVYYNRSEVTTRVKERTRIGLLPEDSENAATVHQAFADLGY